MSKKKVLFIAPRFHTNQFFLTKNLLNKGMDVNFLAIYEGASENHDYIVPILSKTSILSRWYLSRFDTFSIKGRRMLSKYHFTSLRQCFSLYRKLNPDVVVIRNIQFFISIQHFLIALLLGKKIISYTQTPSRRNSSKYRKLLYGLQKLLGVNHFTPVCGDPDKPALPNTLYIPFVIDKFATPQEVRNRKSHVGIRIITIGKLTKRKQLKELVIALRKLHTFNRPDNELIIVSELVTEENKEYLESLKKLIPQVGYKVTVHVNIDHDKVFGLLKKSDLFILPSYGEPAAFSILEAMSCGLPVICSSQNGTKCYIEDDVNGYVFKFTKELDHLIAVLENILNKEKLIKQGLASLSKVEKNHNIQTFYNFILSD